jgi:hypothetical protein
MQIKPFHLLFGGTIAFIVSCLCCREHISMKGNEMVAKFGMMNGHEVELVPLPPFLASNEIMDTFESFKDRGKPSTRTSLDHRYVYFFSVTIEGSDFRIYLNKKAQLANEFQNPTGARRIRELILISKGSTWFDSKFDSK